MSLNSGGVVVSLAPDWAGCEWAHFGGTGGIAQVRCWRGPMGNVAFLDCVVLLPRRKNSLWKRWSCGRETRECGQAVGNAPWRVVHGLSTRPEGRAPVRKDSSTNPRLGARVRNTPPKGRAAFIATPRHAASGVAWPMARNKASRARFACTFASRSVMAWASRSKASKVTPGRKYRSASGSDFSFS